MEKTIINKLNFMAWVIAIFIFFIMIINNIRGLITQAPIAAVLVIPIVVAVYFLIRALTSGFQRFTPKYRIVILCLMDILSLAATLWYAYYGSVKYVGDTGVDTWDWGQLNRTAMELAKGGTIAEPDYYLRYPNNKFWLAFLTLFFKGILLIFKEMPRDKLTISSIILAIVFVRLAIFFIYKTCAEIFGKDIAVLFDFFLLLFCPLYYYAYFSYTDTSGLLCVAIATYLFTVLRKNTGSEDKYSLKMVVLLGFMMALTAKIKILSVLIFPAAIIAEILEGKRKFLRVALDWIKIIAIAIVFFTILGFITNTVVDFPDDENKKYEFPPVHFVMMGLGPSGGYQDKDVAYSYSFDSYESRRQGDMEKLKKRLEERGLLGTLGHLLGKKMLRTWGNSTLAGSDYRSRSPIYEDSFAQRFFGKRGDLFNTFLNFAWIYYAPLIFGCLLNVLFMRKSPMKYEALAVVGLTLFMIVWECNSRYLVTYIPCIFLCSVGGWKVLYEKICLIVNTTHK